MDRKALGHLQEEYRASKLEKEGRYHKVWRPILDEYGLNNFGDVWDHVSKYKEPTDSTWMAGQGRIGSLNVLVRKMAGLTGLRDPEFLVRSENPWDDAVATVLEHAFEQNRRATGWNKESKKAVLEACLFGTGHGKVGYGSEFVYDEVAWSERVPTKARRLLTEADKASPSGLSTEHNFRVQEGKPSMVQVSVQDIFYNSGVRTEADIRRVYHRVRRPVVDVLSDSRFDRVAREQVNIQRWGDESGAWLYLDSWDRDTTFVETVECFDVRSRQFCVFCEGATKALREWTLFPFPIENPHHRFVPIPHPMDVWGIPYALLILGQAQAMNRLRGVIIEAISRDGKKIFLGNADGVDEEERRQIEQARDGQVVWVKGFDPEQGSPFYPMEFGGARPEVLELTRFIERDQAWVSGLTDQTRNDTGSSDETATAVTQRSDQQNLTVDEFVSENESWQEAMAVDEMKIMLARWDQEKLVRVVGPDPNMYFWTSVNVQRMLSSFTLEVVAGSSYKRDAATTRKQWLELLDRIGVLDDRIKMDMQMQQQTGQPGFVNWHAVLQETLDLFDTTLSRKILRPDNMPLLAQRLMDQHQESPLYMSPELERQLQMMGQQPRPAGPFVGGQEGLQGFGVAAGPNTGGTPVPPSFEVAQGVPGVQQVNQATGGQFSETPGMAGRLN